MSNNNSKLTKIHGFSLIELMVVVSIIGLLAAVAVPVYTSYTIRARIGQAQQALNYWITLSEQYADTVGYFPNIDGSSYFNGWINQYAGGSATTFNTLANGYLAQATCQ